MQFIWERKIEFRNKEKKPTEQQNLLVKIRKHKRKLEAMKLLKRKITKLTGSQESFFRVYLKKSGETKIPCTYKKSSKRSTCKVISEH